MKFIVHALLIIMPYLVKTPSVPSGYVLAPAQILVLF